MREVISNGTPRMPGFKYHFEPTQIDAIVAYLKTIPTPPTPVSRSHASYRIKGDDRHDTAAVACSLPPRLSSVRR